MIEIEKKYKIKSESDKNKIIDLLNQRFKIYERQELIDFRYDILENKFKSKDFKRIRIIRDGSGNISFICTRKYSDEDGIRLEDEKEITKEDSIKEINGKIGLLILKERIDYHHIIINGSYFNISVDTLKEENYSCLEIETITNDKSKEESLFQMIDKIKEELFFDFDLEIENKSMLDMSKEYVCKNIDELIDLLNTHG